jgi:hypothetical protein
MNIVKEAHLGAGAYGDVYRIIDRNNGRHVLALKAMKNDPSNDDIREATIKELMNTQNLVHPNIIPVDPLVYNDGTRHSVYINDDRDRIELSLEMMNGDINSLEREQLTPELLRKLVYDVTKGLYHMHSMGYTHNDLKPDNILYKTEGGNYTFKIGDFGLSQYLGIPFPISVDKFICTATVKAPNSRNSSYYVRGNRYNYNSDMFSLGATMFWICMNVHGVRWTDFRINEKEVFVDVRKQNFLDQTDRLKAMYGEEGYDFLVKCMAVKSSERMSSKRALEHPYLRPLRGGVVGDLLAAINSYRQPTIAELTGGVYELEFLDDMYNCYKDRRVNLYVDFEDNTDGLIPAHIRGINDWIYTVNKTLKIETLETFLQTQLNFIHVLNKIEIGTDTLQLNAMCTFRLCHKLLSDFNYSSVNMDSFMWISSGKFTKEELTHTEREILRALDGKITITPVMCFLNYWYLKSVYSSEAPVPNVRVLTTSTAFMLVLLVTNNTDELQYVKLDDLAKYCVKKAIIKERHTEHSDISLLNLDSYFEAKLESHITRFCSIGQSTELYDEIKSLINC